MTQKRSYPEPQKQAYLLHIHVSSSCWNKRVYLLEELIQISVLFTCLCFKCCNIISCH